MVEVVCYIYSSSKWICICANQRSAESTSLYPSKNFLEILLMKLYTYIATSIIIKNKYDCMIWLKLKIQLFSLWVSHTDNGRTGFKMLPTALSIEINLCNQAYKDSVVQHSERNKMDPCRQRTLKEANTPYAQHYIIVSDLSVFSLGLFWCFLLILLHMNNIIPISIYRELQSHQRQSTSLWFPYKC